MKTLSTKSNQTEDNQSFDLFRLQKSKEVVDISPNTLRKWFEQGLPYYRKGKAIFVSKTEVIAFIRN